MLNLLSAESTANSVQQESGSFLGWIVFIFGLCGALYFFYQYGLKAKQKQIGEKKKTYDLSSSAEEVCEGELRFDDIVAFFKLKQLDSENDVPVLIMEPGDVLGGSVSPKEKFKKEGYVSLFAGVYNNQSETLDGKFFYARSLDAKAKEVIGKEKIITLS